jgi:hypothetical protein
MERSVSGILGVSLSRDTMCPQIYPHETWDVNGRDEIERDEISFVYLYLQELTILIGTDWDYLMVAVSGLEPPTYGL